MGVRIDKIVMSSLFEAFKRYDSPTLSMVLSGSIPVGGKAFEGRVSFDRTGSIADIYVKKQGTTYKRSVNSFWKIQDFVGSADVEASIALTYTPTEIVATIYVTNFGGSPFSLTSQTYNLEFKIFDAPITS